MIAALYVQERGCYVGLDGVDPWPESRDARTYAGPRPGPLPMPSPKPAPGHAARSCGLEFHFDAEFASAQALREKQIQQNYRPVIGIHKWFARRPGTLFRSLLLAEFGSGPVRDAFWSGHSLKGTIADPFMGGGTTLYEASRLGFSVIGNDINPMSHWLIERAFDGVDPQQLAEAAEAAARAVDARHGALYLTSCGQCGKDAPVKYFLWVKTGTCPKCSHEVDAFPGHLLAEAVRHPAHVVVCRACGELNEYEVPPKADSPARCRSCDAEVSVEGTTRRGRVGCTNCSHTFDLAGSSDGPPKHRMWAIEYQCPDCYPSVKGRQFKKPDERDLASVRSAARSLAAASLDDFIPDDFIPEGDETARLHRWGYHRYREMFNDRQLLVIGTLAKELAGIENQRVRYALLTVLSDILRYNNMLCRYDTYALKCQDIFSVHGFPVGLVQCENNVLGIPGVGSGGFRHFVEKYLRAVEYCRRPFETRVKGRKKELVYPVGETIGAGAAGEKGVALYCGPSQALDLSPNSLDGVFTDPPYFANVQYSELMDFCYVWLRRIVDGDNPYFMPQSTRSDHEATGNTTAGRGLEEFTGALSSVFQRFCRALKPGAPLVFTYHHNDPVAYVPLVVAVLDSGMGCTAVHPAAAEMSASMHIANTSSSVLDSVFVCRGRTEAPQAGLPFRETPSAMSEALRVDALAMRRAGVKVSQGDLRCLLAGRIAKAAMNELADAWNPATPLPMKMSLAEAAVSRATRDVDVVGIVDATLTWLHARMQAEGARAHPRRRGADEQAAAGRHPDPVQRHPARHRGERKPVLR